MPSEIFWLQPDDVIELHESGLQAFGGPSGIRDANLLHSALVAPWQLHSYNGENDILKLALRLCLRIAKNHPFIDGNKRAALGSMIEFLNINGHDLDPLLDAELTSVKRDLAPGTKMLSDLITRSAAGETTAEQAYAFLRNLLIPFEFAEEHQASGTDGA